jgi:hypothetical protein
MRRSILTRVFHDNGAEALIVLLFTSRCNVRFKSPRGFKKRTERDPGLAVQQLKMGLSKHRRHRNQFSQKTFERLVSVPQRHVLEAFRYQGPKASGSQP